MEMAAEWNVEMWFGLADFEKAFYTVEHEMLWDALSTQGVGSDYVFVGKQPSSSHLVQPIAWRCPDRGLNSTNDVCRTENLVPCARTEG